MKVPRQTRFGYGAAAIAAIVIAGCGSGASSSNTSTSAETTGGAASGGAAVVDTADNSALGQTILVDGQGMTLYLFGKDTNGKSQCSGTCAQNWPPYTTNGQPTAGSDTDDSKLGTVARSDGSMQVTYDGHPLYDYAGDQSAGDANGNGSTAFGAVWHALQPSGASAGAKGAGAGSGGGGSAATTSTTNPSSSGGYSY